MDKHTLTIAWFITPHGFGHAARASAVMLALEQILPVRFEIFTRVPEWFFRESHLENFGYHDCLTDIGLAQATSLSEDLPETLNRLENFLPFQQSNLENLASQVRTLGCRMIVCDIAPLGIAVAATAGLPSVLVENFTWDWIYTGYLAAEPQFIKYIKLLRDWFERADAHIQTEPVCAPGPNHLTTFPVSRPVLTPRSEIRARLDIPAGARVVLITMGGIQTSFNFLEKLQQIRDVDFVIPGGNSQALTRANLHLLPHHSGFYHPDLVAASDAIVGKLGYSTLAEAYLAGTPYGFIPRAQFRESQAMKPFVLEQMGGIEISETSYVDGTWIDQVLALLAGRSENIDRPNGAGQIARYLLDYLNLP